jgi:hypothetical protein
MKQINFSNKTFKHLSCSYSVLSSKYRRVTLRFAVGKAGLISGAFVVTP